MHAAYPYILVVNNVSQVWALYCLVLFFLATQDKLAPMRPLPKFASVKGVVFMTCFFFLTFFEFGYLMMHWFDRHDQLRLIVLQTIFVMNIYILIVRVPCTRMHAHTSPHVL